MDISKNIARIRESKGIKQIEIADKLDIDQPYYSRIEKKGKKLTIEQIETIANALGVGIEEILGFEKKEEYDSQKLIGQIEEKDKLLNQLERSVNKLEQKIEYTNFRITYLFDRFILMYLPIYKTGIVNTLNTKQNYEIDYSKATPHEIGAFRLKLLDGITSTIPQNITSIPQYNIQFHSIDLSKLNEVQTKELTDLIGNFIQFEAVTLKYPSLSYFYEHLKQLQQ